MKRVLLIEDLPQVAQHLQSMLAREKEIEVAGVQSQADAAIAQITTEKPDVVMIDSLLQGKVTAGGIPEGQPTPTPGPRVIMIHRPPKTPHAKDEAAGAPNFGVPGG